MTHHPNDRIENKGRAVVSQMHPYANMTRFLLPLVLVCQLHSQSASFQWIRQIGGSQGQTVAGLAGDSQGNIYVAGNTTSTDFPTQSALQSHPGGSGLYRIDGPGAQWQNLYQSGLSSTEWISSDPRNPNTIYATSIQGMFRSPDAGATWAALTALPVPVPSVTAAPAASKVLAAAPYSPPLSPSSPSSPSCSSTPLPARGSARGRGARELPEQSGDDERDLLADVHGVVADPLQRARDEDHVHRPLARVGVLADLDRHAEDVTVQAVDLVILADDIFGQFDVAPGEGGARLDDLRACLGAHLRQRVEHLAAHRRLMAGERDQLGDVHALVAHLLDAHDHVQQRGDQAQVARGGRLQRKQREDALVDLQVAPVEAVVVGDHHLRELDVLVGERLQHAVELLHDQVQAAERAGLELLQLLLEVSTSLLAVGGGCAVVGTTQRGPRPGGASRTFR